MCRLLSNGVAKQGRGHHDRFLSRIAERSISRIRPHQKRSMYCFFSIETPPCNNSRNQLWLSYRGRWETVLVCSRSIYRSSESALAQDRSLLVKQPSTYIRSFGTGSDGMATHGTCTTGNSGPNSRSSHDCGCPAIVRAARTPLQTLRIVASTVNGDHLSPVAIFSTNLDSILRLVCPSNHLRVRFTPPRRSTFGLRDCCAAELLAVPLPGPLRFFI